MTEAQKMLLEYMLSRRSKSHIYGWADYFWSGAGILPEAQRLREEAEGRWVTEVFDPDPAAAAFGAEECAFAYDDECSICSARLGAHSPELRCPIEQAEASYSQKHINACMNCGERAQAHSNSYCAFAPTRFEPSTRDDNFWWSVPRSADVADYRDP